MDPNEQLIHLITDMKESLEREINTLRHEMQQGFKSVNARFDAQAARLDRHAGYWQAGTRWSSRMDAWAEKIDANAEAAQRDIGELKDRVRQLERRLEDRKNGE